MPPMHSGRQAAGTTEQRLCDGNQWPDNMPRPCPEICASAEVGMVLSVNLIRSVNISLKMLYHKIVTKFSLFVRNNIITVYSRTKVAKPEGADTFSFCDILLFCMQFWITSTFQKKA